MGGNGSFLQNRSSTDSKAFSYPSFPSSILPNGGITLGKSSPTTEETDREIKFNFSLSSLDATKYLKNEEKEKVGLEADDTLSKNKEDASKYNSAPSQQISNSHMQQNYSYPAYIQPYYSSYQYFVSPYFPYQHRGVDVRNMVNYSPHAYAHMAQMKSASLQFKTGSTNCTDVGANEDSGFYMKPAVRIPNKTSL